jgi:anti-sigma factor RsiW
MKRADAYVDRELSAEESRCIRHHLANCEQCAAVVAEKVCLKEKVQASVQSIRIPSRLIWDLQASLGDEESAQRRF